MFADLIVGARGHHRYGADISPPPRLLGWNEMRWSWKTRPAEWKTMIRGLMASRMASQPGERLGHSRILGPVGGDLNYPFARRDLLCVAVTLQGDHRARELVSC